MEEFYQAYQFGLEARVVFGIRIEEYNKERAIRFEDEYYTVIRVTEAGDFLDLICTMRHGGFEEVRA